MPKEFYISEIKKIIPEILKSQKPDGSFECIEASIPNIKNARLQEAALTLAWSDKTLKTDYSGKIENALLFWSALQNKNGSFPELKRESFAATAFSSAAVAQALQLSGNKINAKTREKTEISLKNAYNYLAKNSMPSRTNQEAAAFFAMAETEKLLEPKEKESGKKLENVLANKTPSGFFIEDSGVDLGYSSLACEMLAMAGQENECREFVESLGYLMFPDGTVAANFSRTKGWLILNALELMSKKTPAAKKIAELHINAHKKNLCNATHIISKRHIFTDSYRLCWAYDNCNGSIKPDVKLPFENGEWSKSFPEGITVVKKPKQMAVFYHNGKFTHSIWAENGIVTNLGNNLNGNTVLKNIFVTENAAANARFENGVFTIEGTCSANFGKKNIALKALLKLLLLVRPAERFKKEFKFGKDGISVSITASEGVENVSVLGNVKIEPQFSEKQVKIEGQSIFNGRKDFKVLSKEFKKNITYLIRG